MQSQMGRGSALNKTGWETCSQAAQVVANSVEKFARVQLDTLKTVLRDSPERGGSRTEIDDLPELPARASVTAAERTLSFYDTAPATGVQLLTRARDVSSALRGDWFEALEDLMAAFGPRDQNDRLRAGELTGSSPFI